MAQKHKNIWTAKKIGRFSDAELRAVLLSTVLDSKMRRCAAQHGQVRTITTAKLILGLPSGRGEGRAPRPGLMAILAGNKSVGAKVYGRMVETCLKAATDFWSGGGVSWLDMAMAGKNRPLSSGSIEIMKEIILRGGKTASETEIDVMGSQAVARLLVRHPQVARHPEIVATVSSMKKVDKVIEMMVEPTKWIKLMEEVIKGDEPVAKDWWAVGWYVPVVSQEHWDALSADEWLNVLGWIKTSREWGASYSSGPRDLAWWEYSRKAWWRSLTPLRMEKLGQRGQARILSGLTDKEDRLELLKRLRVLKEAHWCSGKKPK